MFIYFFDKCCLVLVYLFNRVCWLNNNEHNRQMQVDSKNNKLNWKRNNAEGILLDFRKENENVFLKKKFALLNNSYAALVKEQAATSKAVRKERDAKLADLEKCDFFVYVVLWFFIVYTCVCCSGIEQRFEPERQPLFVSRTTR